MRSISPTIRLLSPILTVGLFLLCFFLYYYFLGFGDIATIDMTTDSGAKEYLLRAIWSLSLVMMVTLSIVSIAVASLSVYDLLPERALRVLSGTSLIAVGFSIFPVYFDLGGPVMETLIEQAKGNSSIRFNEILESGVILSSIAIIFIGAAAVTMIRSAVIDGTVEALSRAYNLWTINLILSSILLLVGSMQVHFFNEWISFVIESPHSIVWAFSIGSGVIYTTILVAIFLPTAIILESRVGVLMASELGLASKVESEKWRRVHELYRSPVNVFGRYVLMAAPFLFGTLSELLFSFHQ